MSVPPLRTARLRLEPLVASRHARALHDLYGDAQFAAYLASGAVPTPQAKEEYLSVFDDLPAGLGGWVAHERDDPSGRVVGRFSLRPWRYAEPGDPPEVGWFLAVDRWGRGLAGEGVRAVLDYAASRGHDRVIALVRHDNARSRALAERLGGVVTGQGQWYGEQPSLRYELATVAVSAAGRTVGTMSEQPPVQPERQPEESVQPEEPRQPETIGATGAARDDLVKDPSQWVSGDDPITASQRSYLDTLAKEAGEELPADLTKAEASEHIDRLRDTLGR